MAGEGPGKGPGNAIAMHGEPLLLSGLKHFPYADPRRPQGGRLVLGAQGAPLDGFNPYTVKGVTAAQGVASLTVESLMKRSLDDPSRCSGLIAESIETPDDRSFRHLPPRSEGTILRRQPMITVADVRLHLRPSEGGRAGPTFATPSPRSSASTRPRRTIRFDLAGAGDRELPLIPSA